MSYSLVEMQIIQHAEKHGLGDSIAHARSAQDALDSVFEAIKSDARADMADAYGKVLLELILACACDDLDLVECLKSAHIQKKYLRQPESFVDLL